MKNALLIFTTLLLCVDYITKSHACHNTWQGDNTYVPFQGCVDEDDEDWGMEWRNPYK